MEWRLPHDSFAPADKRSVRASVSTNGPLTVIGSTHLYKGLAHPHLVGRIVVVTGGMRNGELVRDIVALSPRDRVEVVPLGGVTPSDPVQVWAFDLQALDSTP